MPEHASELLRVASIEDVSQIEVMFSTGTSIATFDSFLIGSPQMSQISRTFTPDVVALKCVKGVNLSKPSPSDL